MAVYITTGALGAGKTLWAVSRIEEACLNGVPVATNLDLFPEHLPKNKSPLYRLPDFPKASDLLALGMGGEGRDEKKWGWLVLDEAAAWLNSRGWNDAGRDDLVKWLLHARKKHWNVCLIIQGIEMLDKQIRRSLVEYHVSNRRMDRLNLPLVGKFVNAVSLGYVSGKAPQVHMASINYIAGGVNMHVENNYHKSKHLYAAYDTDQALTASYEHGLYCYLAPYPEKKKEVVKPKMPAIQLMMRLPPDVRIPLAQRYCSHLPA